MSVTLKVTMPVLEELVKRDEDFVVQLSHAAAKEIGEKYGHALLQSKIVQEVLTKLEHAIVSAQTEAGRLLESKVGVWDNVRHTGYRLRQDVVKYIEANFERIIESRFKAWIESLDFPAVLDKLAKEYVETKVEELLKKEVGEFLRGRR